MSIRLLTPLILAVSLLSGCSMLTKEAEPIRSVQDYYQRGHSALNESDWENAIKEFEKLKSVYPYGPWTEQASLELAYSYYRNSEPQSAIREIDEFIRLNPRHKHLAYALYIKALARESTTHSYLDQWISDPARRDSEPLRQAYQDYTSLIERFPTSQYAEDAKLRLIRLRNVLARHELQIAEFYLNRGAHLAAAQRAQYILENYPQTPATLRALQLMAKAYDALGLKDSADEAREVLKLNRQQRTKGGS